MWQIFRPFLKRLNIIYFQDSRKYFHPKRMFTASLYVVVKRVNNLIAINGQMEKIRYQYMLQGKQIMGALCCLEEGSHMKS